MQAVHSSSPLGCVEQPGVSLVHVHVWELLSEDLAGVGFPLDGESGSVSKNEICINPPAGTGKKVSSFHFSAFGFFGCEIGRTWYSGHRVSVQAVICCR